MLEMNYMNLKQPDRVRSSWISRVLFGGLCAAAIESAASAQTSVVRLHPAGAQSSVAYSVANGQQAGFVDQNAAVWTGTAAGQVNLGPGVALDTDGSRQVGVGTFGQARAWLGSAASGASLQPTGTTGAVYVSGVDGNLACGHEYDSAFTVRALAWIGVTNSPVVLSNGLYSSAQDVDAGRIVGSAGDQACMWTSPTPSALVNLAPAGSTYSLALGIHQNAQVGYASFGQATRAILWAGSAASFVDLTPVGATGAASATAVSGDRQVGWVEVAQQPHAALWRGTAASFVDLHQLLPAGYASSQALGVWKSPAGTTYVSGYAANANGVPEAMLWIEGADPVAFCFGDGTGAACPCANSGGAQRGCANGVSAIGARLVASGNFSVGNDQLTLAGDGMPNGPGLYFQGTTPSGGGLGIAFGDGLRCAGGTIVRLGIVPATASASQYPRAGIDPRVSVRGGVAAGDTRVYQLYYRDTAPFCTPSAYNTTNAVSVTWIR